MKISFSRMSINVEDLPAQPDKDENSSLPNELVISPSNQSEAPELEEVATVAEIQAESSVLVNDLENCLQSTVTLACQ